MNSNQTNALEQLLLPQNRADQVSLIEDLENVIQSIPEDVSSMLSDMDIKDEIRAIKSQAQLASSMVNELGAALSEHHARQLQNAQLIYQNFFSSDDSGVDFPFQDWLVDSKYDVNEFSTTHANCSNEKFLSSFNTYLRNVINIYDNTKVRYNHIYPTEYEKSNLFNIINVLFFPYSQLEPHQMQEVIWNVKNNNTYKNSWIYSFHKVMYGQDHEFNAKNFLQFNKTLLDNCFSYTSATPNHLSFFTFIFALIYKNDDFLKRIENKLSSNKAFSGFFEKELKELITKLNSPDQQHERDLVYRFMFNTFHFTQSFNKLNLGCVFTKEKKEILELSSYPSKDGSKWSGINMPAINQLLSIDRLTYPTSANLIDTFLKDFSLALAEKPNSFDLKKVPHETKEQINSILVANINKKLLEKNIDVAYPEAIKHKI